MVQFDLENLQKVKNGPKLKAVFFRQAASGNEPVRIWLKSLPAHEKKQIGEDIKAVQYGWPLGLPLVDHISGDIWEVRSTLETRIARVLFAVEGGVMYLLHGFTKSTRKTPEPDKKTAVSRWKKLKGEK